VDEIFDQTYSYACKGEYFIWDHIRRQDGMSSATAFTFQAKYGDHMADKYIVLKQTDISFIFSMTGQGVFGTATGTQIFPESKKGQNIFYVIIDINVKIIYHKVVVGL